MPPISTLYAPVSDAPDLFQNENEALEKARAIHAAVHADAGEYRQSLGELITHYER
ncbi:MAG TPA: GGDEF domain-containing protein, partial [Paraburkholderia sp.]|nr:GGDEF domain-containing protein [Paraburkholderia sp.]